LSPKRERLQTVNEIIGNCEAEAGEINTALKKISAGGLLEKNLQADMERVERTYAEHLKERDELQKALSVRQLTDLRIKTAMRFREDVVVGIRAATTEDKLRVLDLLRVEYTLKDKTVQVRCLIPMSERDFVLDGCQAA
jgi:hypothetical protein